MTDVLVLVICGLAVMVCWHLMRNGLRIRTSRKRVMMYGELLPAGYRPAYLDIDQRFYVAYPIGLHLLVMAIRRVWEATYWYEPSERERQIAECRCLYDPETDRCVKCGVTRRARWQATH